MNSVDVSYICVFALILEKNCKSYFERFYHIIYDFKNKN